MPFLWQDRCRRILELKVRSSISSSSISSSSVDWLQATILRVYSIARASFATSRRWSHQVCSGTTLCHMTKYYYHPSAVLIWLCSCSFLQCCVRPHGLELSAGRPPRTAGLRVLQTGSENLAFLQILACPAH